MINRVKAEGKYYHTGSILKLTDIRSEPLLLLTEVLLLILLSYQSVDAEERFNLFSCLVVFKKAPGLKTYQLSRVGE